MSNITRRGLATLLFGVSAIATLGFGILSGPAAAADKPKKVIFLVNGTLGDKSYFDLGAAGIQAIKAKYGDAVETKILEMGNDQTKWQPAFEDVSEQDWDLIFACTYEISDIIAEVAPNHPDKTYAVIDAVVPYSQGNLGNVYAVSFKQNEGSYLAGILAAGLLKDGTIPADQGTSIGFLGGMDIPGINDFLAGYIEGAQFGQSGHQGRHLLCRHLRRRREGQGTGAGAVSVRHRDRLQRRRPDGPRPAGGGEGSRQMGARRQFRPGSDLQGHRSGHGRLGGELDGQEGRCQHAPRL